MILETIAEATRKRVAAEKEKCSFAEMKEKATAMNPDTGFPFEQALKKPGMSFICEVKKASPSKGIIAEDFPYLEIAKEYEAAGASAISCLTEPEYFKGVNNRNLKDFTVDIHNSERLRELVPENIVFVSESGIKTPEDVGRLYQNKTDAVLIGETLMRSSNKKAELEKLSSMC